MVLVGSDLKSPTVKNVPHLRILRFRGALPPVSCVSTSMTTGQNFDLARKLKGVPRVTYGDYSPVVDIFTLVPEILTFRIPFDDLWGTFSTRLCGCHTSEHV